MADLIPFDEALAQLLALAAPLPMHNCPITEAGGQFLATDVQAVLTQPPADSSAMDGYALRLADLPGPFRLIGTSAAGAPFAGTLQRGEAVRIFTGAHVPEGADMVAVQEDAEVRQDGIWFPHDGPPGIGAHIRKEGSDFAAGAVLARRGAALTPARLGLLAAAGRAHVPVHRKPRVALLSTGDELVPPGAQPGPGQIIGSNALMLQALLDPFAEVTDLGIAADRPDDLAKRIETARAFDLLVTVGGASVGDHDLVRPALLAAGADLAFWRVAVQPGKPIMAGHLNGGPGGTIVVGLPGNPVSAFVCARLFVLPMLKRLAGDPSPEDRYGEAQTTEALAANGRRRHFMRAVWRDGHVTPAARQDSSLISVLAEANALIVRPEHGPALPAGALIPVLKL